MEKLNCFVMCGMSPNERDIMVFNAFKDYGNSHAKYLYSKHDMSESYCSCYIASGLYSKYCELKDKKIIDFGFHYNNVEFETFRHTLALIKKVTNNLNFSPCGEYVASHMENENMSYLPNVFAIYHKGELKKENCFNTHMVDLIDVLEQWENRTNQSERKLRSAMACLSAAHVRGNSLNVDNCEVSSKYFDFLNDATINHYSTPEADTIYNECINNASFMITDLKQKKNFSKVAEVLKHGEKSNTDKSIIKRFKDRNNLQSLSFAELKYLFG